MTSRTRNILLVGGIGIVVVAAVLLSPLIRNKTLNESVPGTVSNQQLDKAIQDMEDERVSADMAMPSDQPVVRATADFVPSAHDVDGRAVLLDVSGKQYVRFEDFMTTNGPDLRIYLSAGLDNKDYIDLGAIKATDGNINYEVPAGTDTAKYKHVLVWCRAFSVLFSYATLGEQ